jgi:hypothetical protein
LVFEIKKKTTIKALKAKIEELYIFKQDTNPPANSYFIFRRGEKEPLISIMKDNEVPEGEDLNKEVIMHPNELLIEKQRIFYKIYAGLYQDKRDEEEYNKKYTLYVQRSDTIDSIKDMIIEENPDAVGIMFRLFVSDNYEFELQDKNTIAQSKLAKDAIIEDKIEIQV